MRLLLDGVVTDGDSEGICETRSEEQKTVISRRRIGLYALSAGSLALYMVLSLTLPPRQRGADSCGCGAQDPATARGFALAWLHTTIEARHRTPKTLGVGKNGAKAPSAATVLA